MHPHVHLVVKAEHEYGGRRLNPRKADLQRWRERFAEYLTELGVSPTATRREDRGLVEDRQEDPDLSRAHREPEAARRERGCNPRPFEYVGGGFGLHAQEARGRQARAAGTGRVADREQYRSLMNVRAQVNDRYGEAIEWLRRHGREEEARRFELMQRNLAPVKAENQVLAEALAAARRELSGGPSLERGSAESRVR